ncbi:MAG TPA: serine hydrolase domain-containing protein [Thermoanaerobaculia bacterium]|nr:serine hydrolase domain-containing protein [Thermoanaerobaculia bacterium]
MKLALLLLFAASAFAQNAKVDALFSDVDKPDSPGYAVAVIQNGQIVHARGYGMADLERDVKLTPQSVFDIGSTSKQFTAACILLLEQEGKLALGDDIRKHLPEMPAYERPVTVGHLLHHTSGIRDYLTLMTLAGLDARNDFTDEETLALIARQKALNFLPGDEYLYSNSGYYLLSQIVERASGRSLRRYADEKIFKPLGMTSTHFHDDPAEVVKRRAIGYAPSKDGFRISMSNYHVTGDGALYTTVEDLAKWDANFYEPKVGGQALLDAQHRVGKLTGGKELPYAAGLMIRKHEGLRMVQHGGAWMGYRAQLVRFPEKKLSVAVLSNLGSANPDEKAMKIAALYLDLKPAETPAAPVKADAIRIAPEELARYAKTYYNQRGGGYRRVEVRDGKLMYGPRELRPVGGAKFSLDGPVPVFLTFRENSALVEVEGEEPNEIPAVQLVTPDAAALAQYAGQYRSEELQAGHRLRVKDGALHVRPGYGQEVKLEPRERDVFEGQGVLVRFRRDANGAIRGYTIGAGRVTNISFDRK